MAKIIVLDHEGQEYTLEFTRRAVPAYRCTGERAEGSGSAEEIRRHETGNHSAHGAHQRKIQTEGRWNQ